MNERAHFVLGNIELIETVTQNRKQLVLQQAENRPIALHAIHIISGNAAFQMCLDALQIFADAGIDIAGNVQVIIVLTGDFTHRYKTRIMRIVSDLLIKGGYDFINITLAQTVLVAVLYKIVACVDHKDAGALIRIFFVNDNNACRDTGTIEQVCRQTNDTLDVTGFDQGFSNFALCVATEQHAVGQNNCSFTGTLQGFEYMHQPRIVAVLFGRSFTVSVESAVFLYTISPVFDGERRVCYDIVKSTQHCLIRSIFKILRIRESVACFDCSNLVMKHCIHNGQTGGGGILFLTIAGQVDGCLIQRTNKQRAGTASGVINGSRRSVFFGNADHLSKNTGHLGRGIELTFTLAALCRKLTHQIFVCIANKIVVFSTVFGKIQFRTAENLNELTELFNHLIALAELVGVIERNLVNNATQIIGCCQLCNNLIDAFSDVLLADQLDHIVKATTLRDFDVGIVLTCEFVRNVFHEQKGEDIIFILRGIHAAS